MNNTQKVIKYLVTFLALILIFSNFFCRIL